MLIKDLENDIHRTRDKTIDEYLIRSVEKRKDFEEDLKNIIREVMLVELLAGSLEIKSTIIGISTSVFLNEKHLFFYSTNGTYIILHDDLTGERHMIYTGGKFKEIVREIYENYNKNV